MPSIVFLHGLCSFRDDQIHVGPFAFGRFDRFLKLKFSERSLSLVSVDGIGSGSPEEQAETADASLRTEGALESEVIVLGHSIGGLTARALQPRLERSGHRVAVLTWGTPHRGTPLGAFGHIFNRSTLLSLRPAVIARFNERYPFRENGQYSIHCSVSIQNTPPLFWPFVSTAPSDGLISLRSQIFGHRLGHQTVDHFSALGYTGFHSRPSAQTAMQREFSAITETMVEFITNGLRPEISKVSR